jgi:hypothetical protein
VPARLVLIAALAIGSALGMRIGAVTLLGYLGFLGLGWVLAEGWRNADLRLGSSLRRLLKLMPSGIALAVVSWGVMCAWWPWAQVNPIGNPLKALALFQYYPWRALVFFEGNMVPAPDLPRSYLPTWLAISLPEFYFVALGLGAVAIGALALRAWTSRPKHVQILTALRQHQSAEVAFWIKIALLSLAVLLPVGGVVARHAVLYDGLRLFLFVLPPLAVLGGVAVARFFDTPRVGVRWKSGVALVLGLSMLVTVIDLARLHPYEYVYFNRLVAGGQQAGALRFETDGWGLSYKEGVDWLLANYRPNSAERVRVANCSRPVLSSYFLEKAPAARQRFVAVPPNQSPQVFLATTRFNCHAVAGGKVLHVVERAGTPLMYVFQTG